MKIIGPFSQIVTLRGMPLKGSLSDNLLDVVVDGAVLVDGAIVKTVDTFDKLHKNFPAAAIEHIHDELTLVPGFIDCHTHLCFAGSRANDYALRVSGKTYLEIAQSGGGIWDTVRQTRLASEHDLMEEIIKRAEKHLHAGITTIEIKSGYGLETAAELRMLRAIKKANQFTTSDLISTCLAAHMLPKDFNGNEVDYLDYIITQLLPTIQKEKLTRRFDIFIEKSAFDRKSALHYLQHIKQLGYDITVHADQFSVGGSEVALLVGALSADHLESSSHHEIHRLANSDTVAVALPGASIGLGMAYAPARKLLDNGACVAIASDWNPGSAPMGQLLTQASILGAYEKLTIAETLAALTYRAAKALNLADRGIIDKGYIADLQAYHTKDYKDIFYYQGSLKPQKVWKNGQQV
ncbi:imidazolonepropionase [Olivibacter domesticus]|uniref:Imidazolonepropionase n=1 Tax=Olivibacter domesticus TaxID=407022 RepID=A0A1H7HSN4_OLID1|nr:imidazolonepropionase [Olivibacter domesticus]SEK52050.1 imidazolonepropionase [Olivibacter domesticus]